MSSPLGSAIRRALAASRCGLVLNLRPNSLPLRGDALGDLLRRSRPAATPPCRRRRTSRRCRRPSTPAPITCTRSGLKARLLGRLRLHHLGQPEHAAQVPRRVADHQRREGARLGHLHAVEVAGVASRTDRSAGTARGSAPRAPSWPSRSAACLASSPRAGHMPRERTASQPRRLRLALALDRLARRPAQVQRARRPARR